MKSNTVVGVPERVFRAVWVKRFWAAMSKTGRGFRKPSASELRGAHRRADKVGTSKVSRQILAFAAR